MPGGEHAAPRFAELRRAQRDRRRQNRSAEDGARRGSRGRRRRRCRRRRGRSRAAIGVERRPACAARASAARSARSSGSTAWASGSPKRTLYSTRRGPVGGEHQPGVEHADVRRAGGGEVVEHRLHERRRRARRRRTAPAPARRRPCRRCSGRCRPRRCACGPGRAAAPGPCVPSHSASSEHSGPRHPLLEHERARRRRAIAASVSASSAGTVTPLPAASPSSLTTTGRPSARHHASAPSTSPASKRANAGPGMPSDAASSRA